jgi:hypothetical protein
MLLSQGGIVDVDVSVDGDGDGDVAVVENPRVRTSLPQGAHWLGHIAVAVAVKVNVHVNAHVRGASPD